MKTAWIFAILLFGPYAVGLFLRARRRFGHITLRTLQSAFASMDEVGWGGRLIRSADRARLHVDDALILFSRLLIVFVCALVFVIFLVEYIAMKI